MARKQPEMGYFEQDGNVSHGIIGLTPGRPISTDEAHVISKAKRALVPPPAVADGVPSAPQAPAASRSDVEDLKAQVAKLTAFITDLPSVKG